MNYNHELLKKGCEHHNISITEKQLDDFEKYATLLIEWNKKINLTAICSPDDIAIKHFLDSIVFLSKIGVKSGDKFIDIGAGAGFPSIPLAIMHPDCKFVMVDSLNKRVNFLNLVCDELKINGSAVHFRAEDAGKEISLRENFDFAVARAVAPLNVLAEYCIPFVKQDGSFVAFKGPDCKDEVENSKNAIEILGGNVSCIHEFELDPLGENKRTLIEIKKIIQTLTKYPRNSKEISKKPL